jgi:hypothetical protein
VNRDLGRSPRPPRIGGRREGNRWADQATAVHIYLRSGGLKGRTAATCHRQVAHSMESAAAARDYRKACFIASVVAEEATCLWQVAGA